MRESGFRMTDGALERSAPRAATGYRIARASDPRALEARLSDDRPFSAYALGHLEPELLPQTEFWTADGPAGPATVMHSRALALCALAAFFVGCGEDPPAQQGQPGIVVARVTDDRLAETLGMDQVVLDYNFSNWAVITDVHPDTTVWLRGDVEAWDGTAFVTLQDAPLLVSHETNRGIAVMMTFHGNAQTFAVTDTLLTTVLGELPPVP